MMGIISHTYNANSPCGCPVDTEYINHTFLPTRYTQILPARCNLWVELFFNFLSGSLPIYTTCVVAECSRTERIQNVLEQKIGEEIRLAYFFAVGHWVQN